MKITYTGKQTVISLFVKRKEITLKPNVPVEVTAEQLKDIEQRKYFKSLLDTGLIVVEGKKPEASKQAETAKPVKKTTTRSTKKAEDK